MGELWIVIPRKILAGRLGLPDWVPILNHLADSLITRPRDLSRRPHAGISVLAATSPEPSAIIGLFREALVAFSPLPTVTPGAPWPLLASAHALVGRLRVSSVAATPCARFLLRSRFPGPPRMI